MTPGHMGGATPGHGGATPGHGGARTPFHESVWNPSYGGAKAPGPGEYDPPSAGAGAGAGAGAEAPAAADFRAWGGVLVEAEGRPALVKDVLGGEVQVVLGEASEDLRTFRPSGEERLLDGSALSLVRPSRGSVVKVLGGDAPGETRLRIRFLRPENPTAVCDSLEGGATVTHPVTLLGVCPEVEQGG